MMDFTKIEIDEMQDYFDAMITGSQDGYGYTLLHYICGKQSETIINFLLWHQQNIVIKQNYTLQDYINEHIDILPGTIKQYEYYIIFLEKMIMLLSTMCQQGIHVQDIDNNTPLYHAVFYHPDSKYVATLLMKYGGCILSTRGCKHPMKK